MWPNRHLGTAQNPRPMEEPLEVEEPRGRPTVRRFRQQRNERNLIDSSSDESDEVQHGRPIARRSRRSRRQRYERNFFNTSSDESESEDEIYLPDANATHLERLLMFTSLENFAAVQRTSAMRPSPCDCTEVLSSQGASIISTTSCIGPRRPYPNIVCYTPMQRTRRMVVEDQPNRQSASENVPLNSRHQTTRAGSSVNAEYLSAPTQSVRRNTLFFSKDLPTPGLAHGRRRLRSVQKMAPACNVAVQVANRVIRYARCIRNTHERDMCCINCGLFPVDPVTGQCGHTRCAKCTKEMSTCPCGNNSPQTLNVNVLIRDLIRKTSSFGQSSSNAMVTSTSVRADDNPNSAGVSTAIKGIPNQALNGACSSSFQLKGKAEVGISTHSSRTPMSPRKRFNYALELLQTGRHHEAAPHLALAAASTLHDLEPARMLLAQVVSHISEDRDPRSVARHLNHTVRKVSCMSGFKPGDMECILCYDTFTNPVTTPCGHMFCRTCLERTLDYNKRCPLCLQSLLDFKLTATGTTVFVQAALRSINVVKTTPPPLESDLIPIFVCTVAFPSIPCPLFIFDPRYWLMIRRVLESGSRKFGMVADNRGQDYAVFGTILEVRDCVQLKDGRSILSTVGLSRFKVIERGVNDGCEVARIVPVTDILPNQAWAIWELKLVASRIMYKAMTWLARLNRKVKADIEAAFGRLPHYDNNEAWWEYDHGPLWLWWLVAVLPLKTEIKVLILSTNCLLKRMSAVLRTLDAIHKVTIPIRSVE